MAKTAERKRSPNARKKASAPKAKPARKWSGKVTEKSHALDLESKIFKSNDPVKVARSLKRSSEKK